MRIVIDASQIVYRGTGVGRYVYGLTKALLSLNSPHQFTFFVGVWRKKKEIEALRLTPPFDRADWHVTPLPPKLANQVFNHTPLPIEIFTGKHDLFHASDWTEPESNMPRVTTVHDLAFRRYPETIAPLIRETHTIRLERIVRHKTHIIADSLSTKKDLIELYSLPEERITVIYPGIESGFKPQSKKEIDRVKNKYKLPTQFILSVGTQEPRKNLERLAAATKKLNLPLILVGRHGWGDLTQTLGYVSDTDLPGLYSAASVFAYPSLYEGFGFPVLEAMSCGTPVTTSNTSSLPEIVGQAGVLFDPLDVSAISAGIEKALKNSSKLVTAGRRQAAKFTWESCAKKTLEVYEQISRR